MMTNDDLIEIEKRQDLDADHRALLTHVKDARSQRDAAMQQFRHRDNEYLAMHAQYLATENQATGYKASAKALQGTVDMLHERVTALLAELKTAREEKTHDMVEKVNATTNT